MNSIADKLEKLNRLRTNARKNPLKVWRGSDEALDQQIKRFEDEGYEDSVPGAAPIPDDYIAPTGEEGGEVADKPKGKEADVSGLNQPMPRRQPGTDVPEGQEVKRGPARIARGVEGPFTEHSRKAIADQRELNKKERKQKKRRTKEVERIWAGKKKKVKKSKIKHRKDGTAVKTTTNGNKRELGSTLAQRIKQMHEAKHADKRADANNFTVAELARKLDIDPKVARAKLRRHEGKIKKLHSKGQDRWVFPNSAEPALTKILRGK